MKSDVAQQHLLLTLAGIDAELVRLTHRATHLPEQLAYDTALAEVRAATDRLGALAVALDDVEAEVARMEAEVDAVRRREDRDRALLESGTVSPKQLEELQHELTTLERRQADLEDVLLEVMERREEIAGAHAAQQAAAEALGRNLESLGSEGSPVHSSFSLLFVAVDDASTGQIVRRQLDHHPVLRKDPNVVLTHLAADGGKHLVTVVQLNTEHRVG